MDRILLALNPTVSQKEISEFIQDKEHIVTVVKDLEELSRHQAGRILLITDKEEFYTEALSRGMAFLIYLSDLKNSKAFPKATYAITTLDGVEMSYLDKVFRRFHHLPWHILDTKRCRVREMTMDDLDALYKIYENPSITRYMEGLYEEREKEAAYTEDYIKSVYGFYGYGLWMIEEKTTGQIIGRAGLSHREGYEEPELGYVIGKPYQNQGYATEVCRAIIQYGMEEIGFSHFNAFVHKENQPSIRICEKCGFVRIGQVTVGDELLERYYL